MKKNISDFEKEIIFAYHLSPHDMQIDITPDLIEDISLLEEKRRFIILGCFLHKTAQGFEENNINMWVWLIQYLQPLPIDVEKVVYDMHLSFLKQFTSRQIRLLLFSALRDSRDKFFCDELQDFILYWSERYYSLLCDM